MLALSLIQRFAVIGAMPTRTLRHADTPLFDALGRTLAQIPTLSLIASVERAFALEGLVITAAEAAPIARAIAVAESDSTPLLGSILAQVRAPTRDLALA